MSETRTDRNTATAGPEAPRPPADPEALRAEIELTRAQLADTVAALAAKADVKSRVRGSVSAVSGQVRNRVREAAGHARQTIGGAGERVPATTQRGGYRPGPEAAPALPGRRQAPTVAAGALGGALIALIVYLLWRGRR